MPNNLAFDPEEAANLRVRNTLMGSLLDYVRKRRLSLDDVAQTFELSAPTAQALVSNDVHKFPIDVLVKLVWMTGKEVRVVVTDREET